jgi:hypothetical protein
MNPELKKHVPKIYSSRRCYIPADVEQHSTAVDCWVSYFHKVYDLSPLLLQHKGDPLCTPIIQAAGTDITHWFDPATHDPKTFLDPASNLKVVWCPQGRFLHVPPVEPDAAFDNSFDVQWWRDDSRYCIGTLTKKVRKIRLINMLSKQDDILQVASEETLNEILDRYLPLNDHAASYTWKRLGRPLDMELTLEENEIKDETEEFILLNLDPESYIPAIHLYYNDDLTVK